MFLKQAESMADCDPYNGFRVSGIHPQCQLGLLQIWRTKASPLTPKRKRPHLKDTTSHASPSSTTTTSSYESGMQSHPAKKRQLSPLSFIPDASFHNPTVDQDQTGLDLSFLDADGSKPTSSQDDNIQTAAFDGLPTSFGDLPTSFDGLPTGFNLDVPFDFTGSDQAHLPHNKYFIFGDGNSSNMEIGRGSAQDQNFDYIQQLPFTTFPQPGQEPPSPQCQTFDHLQQPPFRSSPQPRQEPLSPPYQTFDHIQQLPFHPSPQPGQGLPPPPNPAIPASPDVQSNVSLDDIVSENAKRIESADYLYLIAPADNPHYALRFTSMCIDILGKYEDVIRRTPLPLLPSLEGHMDAKGRDYERIQYISDKLTLVKKLVDQFEDKYCCNEDGSVNVDANAIYGQLESYMREELGKTSLNLLNMYS